MKISILLTDGGKQIMMTPENDHEKTALKMIAPGDELKVVTKWGNFWGENEKEKIYGVSVAMNQAGYFRTWSDQDSLMFVIEDHKNNENLSP